MNRKLRLALLVITSALIVGVGQAADVKTLWKKNCAACHGPDGKGKTKAGRLAGVVDLTNPEVQDKYSDEEMLTRVKEGVREGDTVKMKPAEKLSNRDIKKLIAFVRTFKR